ncbi:hypothetical protein [Paeniglutamicibacter gangotriensis]|uniref:Uncharacterized protein n=1 Tax=Paeniglutamicibacter gangotriensis Lz1y TaxID=1276920 RepID=M7MV98_9MICC|nr:hypothetical protein [Paeniglutamicibacter gangotriensis]EMR00363.1 hypothetical protein ADIAG_00370 [Paeniglutamicibacter gangotriensis Lz1y]
MFYSKRQQRLATKMNCCVSRAVPSATEAQADAVRTGSAVITIKPN